MARHQCGAENPDSAKFCSGCGENLKNPAGGATTAPSLHSCPDCGAANKPTAKFCGKCGASMVVASAPAPAPLKDSAPVAVPAVESQGDASAPASAFLSRKVGVLLVAGAVLAVGLGGASWWMAAKRSDTTAAEQSVGDHQAQTSPSRPVTEAAAKAPAPAPAVIPVAAPAPAVPAVPAQHEPTAAEANVTSNPLPQPRPADPSVVAEQSSQATADEKMRRLREEKMRRKAEQDAKRLEAEKARRLAAEEQAQAAERARNEERARAEEARRRAQQQPAGGSVQQTCGKYSSSLSRSLCETKECARPSLYDTPYCVEFRKRYGDNTNNGNPQF